MEDERIKSGITVEKLESRLIGMARRLLLFG